MHIWITKFFMKAQLILLLLLATVVSTNAFASDTDPKQEIKKTQKSKYDFNIFKLYSIAAGQELPDSLTIDFKALPPKREEK
mgnify:CR=1 FL=1